ncbi:MAG: thioredoxin family protein [Archangium sp.]|nr:thioredoxin family protein [Archangium sp.]
MFEDLPLDVATARAKERGKFLLIDFTATWCAPCAQMDKTTWKDAEVHAWVAEHAIAIQIDVDQHESLSEEWNVQSIPTVMLRKDAAELDRASGMRSAKQILTWLKNVSTGRTELDSLREFEESDVMARFKLVRTLVRSRHFDEALEHAVWLWEHSLEHEPNWTGVRLSYLMSEIDGLLKVHPPTRPRLEALRAEAKNFHDWVTLSQSLGLESEVVERVRSMSVAESFELELHRIRRVVDLLEERGEYLLLGNILQEPVALLREGGEILDHVLQKTAQHASEFPDVITTTAAEFRAEIDRRKLAFIRALEEAGRASEADDVRALEVTLRVPEVKK